jgi:hypothetical protein
MIIMEIMPRMASPSRLIARNLGLSKTVIAIVRGA